jgi:hypothetical protein
VVPGSDTHWHDDIFERVVAGKDKKGAGIGVRQVQFDAFIADVVEDVKQVGNVEADIQRFAAVYSISISSWASSCSALLEMIFRLPGESTRRTPRNFSLVRMAARSSECSRVLRESLMSLGVMLRDHALVIRKFAVDQL